MPSTILATAVLVLVVEDEALLRLHAVELIEEQGYAVLEARNADQAIALLESRPDITIMFTDIDMPGSMDGLRLAAAVRNRWPPIEIIVTSGHTVPALDDLPDRGVFLYKPYRDDKLVEHLQKMSAR